ncbi:hypothetical protein SAMN05192551_1171 [Tindallia magadiensis]|uniref:DUF5704 domain-containing protein n=1 Tax=Tindallia magadiensis TaxID=69895 RepID=A0A1I3HV94_9FIRM|nr:hypothetical protein [Tindallia magadiensis]SFI39543.1 hypothetical protein SAMN05192551_1171 [Tindallia magadiensis]
MTKRIIAFALLLSLLLSSPIYASEERPLLIALENSVLQGPDSETPIEDVTIIVDKDWSSYNISQVTWTMPSRRPVEIKSELYPSTRSIEEEHFLVGGASSRGNRYHAELMRVDRYPFQVTEEGDWEASEDITLFIPFTDRETETEYFLVSSLTEDQYQQLHQRSVVNYDGYVSAYTIYRQRYESDFNPEGNTDYQEDYYWKLFDLERAGNHPESVTLTFQGTSIHVNSEGEVVHGFSDTASAPMAAAEPLGLMSFSDGSLGIQSTSTTIKSLDDFQNLDQFHAFLNATANKGLSFWHDGIATVEVKYRHGITETLHVHKDFFSLPDQNSKIHGKGLHSVNGDSYSIIVQESGDLTGFRSGVAGIRFTELQEVRRAMSHPFRSTRLEIDRIYYVDKSSKGRYSISEPPRLSAYRGYPIANVEMVQSIQYHFPEGMGHPVYDRVPSPKDYIHELETMLSDTLIEPNPDEKAIFDLFLNKMAKKRKTSSHYRFLPPVIAQASTDGNVTRDLPPFLTGIASDWVGLFPYGQYAGAVINGLDRWYSDQFSIGDTRLYVRNSPVHNPNHYETGFVTQIENSKSPSHLFTPTLGKDGKEQKGLVKHVGVRIEKGYLASRGDFLDVTLAIYEAPDELSDFQRMPYSVHTEYEMTLGKVPYYFDGTIDSGGGCMVQ